MKHQINCRISLKLIKPEYQLALQIIKIEQIETIKHVIRVNSEELRFFGIGVKYTLASFMTNLRWRT